MNGQMELDLGTSFHVNLERLSNSETGYTIEQFSAALEATTTLTVLHVLFDVFNPMAGNNGRIVNSLCQLLSNVRRQNEHHPLRTLVLGRADLSENGTLNVFEQFMIAAKQAGIKKMHIFKVKNVPVQLLEEFYRDNTILELLDVASVSLSSRGTTLSLPPNDGRQDAAESPAPSISLCLEDIWFSNSTAATNFSKLMAHMNVWCMIIAKITARGGSNDDGDDIELTKRIMSEFKWPRVKKLVLLDTCQLEHFEAALEALTTSVEFLVVYIDCFTYNDTDASAKLDLLARFFRSTVKLGIVWLSTRITPPREVYDAMEACATLLVIQASTVAQRTDRGQLEVMRNRGLIPVTQFEQQLQKIAVRNCNLAHFVAISSAYPTNMLPAFIPQFVNCPTGRYILARSLPGVLSFETMSQVEKKHPKQNKREGLRR